MFVRNFLYELYELDEPYELKYAKRQSSYQIFC